MSANTLNSKKISRNSGKIPSKFRRKIADVRETSWNFCKILKFRGILKRTASFDFGAVQKFGSQVDKPKRVNVVCIS